MNEEDKVVTGIGDLVIKNLRLANNDERTYLILMLKDLSLPNTEDYEGLSIEELRVRLLLE